MNKDWESGLHGPSQFLMNETSVLCCVQMKSSPIGSGSVLLHQLDWWSIERLWLPIGHSGLCLRSVQLIQTKSLSVLVC